MGRSSRFGIKRYEFGPHPMNICALGNASSWALTDYLIGLHISVVATIVATITDTDCGWSLQKVLAHVWR
jgi:hypothetical protein